MPHHDNPGFALNDLLKGMCFYPGLDAGDLLGGLRISAVKMGPESVAHHRLVTAASERQLKSRSG